jgi:hypothetical protein
VCETLVLKGLRPVAVKGLSAIVVTHTSKRGSWPVVARVDEVEERLVLYSILFAVEPARRDAAREYIGRANWGLPTGAFEMDPDSGDVRFRTGFDATGIQITPELLNAMWTANVLVTGRYRAGLLNVADGVHAAEALAAIDG